MKKYYSSVIHFMFQIVELRKFHREKFRLLVGFLFVVSAPMQMSIDSSNGLIFVKICTFFFAGCSAVYFLICQYGDSISSD